MDDVMIVEKKRRTIKGDAAKLEGWKQMKTNKNNLHSPPHHKCLAQLLDFKNISMFFLHLSAIIQENQWSRQEYFPVFSLRWYPAVC